MYKTCPSWLREAYRKAVKFTCESCKKHEDEVGKLEVHRVKRGRSGGTYRPGNVKMLCKKHHKMIHSGEFR